MTHSEPTQHETDEAWKALEKIKYSEPLMDNIKDVLEWKHDFFEPHFPKSCFGCDNLVATYAHFEALPIVSGESVDESFILIRLCECGEKIGLVVRDQRDDTSLGQARRDFFEICVEHIQKEMNLDAERASLIMRSFFKRGAIFKIRKY